MCAAPPVRRQSACSGMGYLLLPRVDTCRFLVGTCCCSPVGTCHPPRGYLQVPLVGNLLSPLRRPTCPPTSILHPHTRGSLGAPRGRHKHATRGDGTHCSWRRRHHLHHTQGTSLPALLLTCICSRVRASPGCPRMGAGKSALPAALPHAREHPVLAGIPRNGGSRSANLRRENQSLQKCFGWCQEETVRICCLLGSAAKEELFAGLLRQPRI